MTVNSSKAWFLAARPKTLTGAVAPVMVALALAWRDEHAMLWLPAILCLSFAVLMQIDANFINDYYDCLKGDDGEDRLGPERACSMGWISLSNMRIGIILTTIASALVGLPLVWYGGWFCIVVGVACILFTFLYTTVFSRIAMGDVLVLLFFGIIPITCTYYIQTGNVTAAAIELSLAQGLVTDCLLLVNNFRDREVDHRHGKQTLVTIIGERGTLFLYLMVGLAAGILAVNAISSPLPNLYLPINMLLVYRMYRIGTGRELNKVLGMTAMSIFLFAILIAMASVTPNSKL